MRGGARRYTKEIGMTQYQYLLLSVQKNVGANECWIWSWQLNDTGYGTLKVNAKRRTAHRVAYELRYGEIPKGLELDHLCRNRACINPLHLEPVTHKENMSRGDKLAMSRPQREKTHCKNGHELVVDNLYLYEEGRRICRACKLISVAKYQAKKSVS